jgi:dihydrofolate reductase
MRFSRRTGRSSRPTIRWRRRSTGIAKYVLSGSDLKLPWANSHRLDGIEAVAALKAQDGPNLVIQGSSTLYPQLLRHGLIDRIVTMTAPVVLGRGQAGVRRGTAPGAFGWSSTG